MSRTCVLYSGTSPPYAPTLRVGADRRVVVGSTSTDDAASAELQVHGALRVQPSAYSGASVPRGDSNAVTLWYDVAEESAFLAAKSLGILCGSTADRFAVGITQDRRVGVGISNPTCPFEVVDVDDSSSNAHTTSSATAVAAFRGAESSVVTAIDLNVASNSGRVRLAATAASTAGTTDTALAVLVNAGANVSAPLERARFTADGRLLVLGTSCNVASIIAAPRGTLDVAGSAYVDGAITVTGDASIQGNLFVNGTTTTVDTETVLIRDNIVTLNSSLTSGTPPSTLVSGLEVLRGDLPTYRFAYDEMSRLFKIGHAPSNFQAVATRRDSMADGFGYWNSNEATFTTSNLAGAFDDKLSKSASSNAQTVAGSVVFANDVVLNGGHVATSTPVLRIAPGIARFSGSSNDVVVTHDSLSIGCMNSAPVSAGTNSNAPAIFSTSNGSIDVECSGETPEAATYFNRNVARDVVIASGGGAVGIRASPSPHYALDVNGANRVRGTLNVVAPDDAFFSTHTYHATRKRFDASASAVNDKLSVRLSWPSAWTPAVNEHERYESLVEGIAYVTGADADVAGHASYLRFSMLLATHNDGIACPGLIAVMDKVSSTSSTNTLVVSMVDCVVDRVSGNAVDVGISFTHTAAVRVSLRLEVAADHTRIGLPLSFVTQT